MPDLTPTTFLAPGQRYAPTGSPAWRADRQVTILRVGHDVSGRLRVAYCSPSGDRVDEPIAQFEAAVADGQFVPVAGWGRLGGAD
jgi:hypothetical protein